MSNEMHQQVSKPSAPGFLTWLAGLLLLLVSIWGAPGLLSEASAQGGTSRTDIEFAHASTGFQLTGGHAQVPCERCHVQGVFRGTPTQCMQCHSPGGRVVSSFKPANHLPTTVNCNSCHRTTNWKPAFFTHNGVAPGSCVKCHNNSIVQGKPATHIPTSMSCDNCHRPVSWTSVSFRHIGVASGTCATCHNGVQAPGKPATHIVTALSCDSCHKMGTTWVLVSGSKYNHSGITSGCVTCHGGTTAGVMGKPSGHIPTALGCEVCHTSDRKSTRLNSSHSQQSRMPSSA